MALNAKFVGCGKGQHSWIVCRAASLVATETSHGKVLVPRIYSLLANRVGRMGLPFVTLGAQINTGKRLLQ